MINNQFGLGLLVGASFVFSGGCSDGIECPGDLGLTIVSPSLNTPINAAQDQSEEPGLQVPVRLESLLQKGDRVTLRVDDASGGTEGYSATAEENGDIEFASVTLPSGTVNLTVSAESRRCGDQIISETVQVTGDACSFAFVPQPMANEFYGVGVLTSSLDQDPDTDGFQGSVVVTTEPGFAAELFVNDPTGGGETSRGVRTADSDGEASLALGLGQGSRAVRVECSSADETDMLTSLAQNVFVDTLKPECELENPGDGTLISPVLDEDPAAGVQLTLMGRVTSEQDDVLGEPAEFVVGGDTIVGTDVDASGATVGLANFLENGSDTVGFAGRDHAGNTCVDSSGVDINLDLVAVVFSDPVADGIVGPGDGLDTGGALEVVICGTVAEAGFSVDVSIDGGAPIAAQVAGTDFCLPIAVSLAESPPTHTLVATATDGSREGLGTADVVVDLTPPLAPGGLQILGPNRQALDVNFVAPSDGLTQVVSYDFKLAEVPLTGTNFNDTGIELLSPAPATAGTPQSISVETLRPGVSYYVGAVATDAAGNRSGVATAGPLALDFDSSGIVSSGENRGRLGHAMASGRWSGDAFSDLAAGEPYSDTVLGTDVGVVRLYAGSTDGIGNTADLIIEGTSVGGRFGHALAALDWNDDGTMDLAVGQPLADGGLGEVHIFFGPIDAVPADVVISVAPASVALAGAELGTSLAAADFDGDGRDDLVMGAPGAGAGDGAAVVLFGGAAGAAIALDEADVLGDAGFLIGEPAGTVGARFGQFVSTVGATESALDDDDDIGIAYADQNTAYVFRGRDAPASMLTALAYDGGVDLELVYDSVDTTTEFGGQLVGIEDQDDDGIRDIVVSAWRQGGNRGRVVVVTGGLVGSQFLAGNPVIAIINPGNQVTRLGAGIASGLATSAPDIDADGREDLVMAAVVGGNLSILAYYGGELPTGTVNTNGVPYLYEGPALFRGRYGLGLPGVMTWIDDLNQDGLADLVFADPAADNDGAFELLWDE